MDRRATIYALSSGHPPAGVAVIRLSGPRVRFGLETLIGSVPTARTAHLAQIRDPAGTLLDRGLVLFFPEPNSFTGEDVAELQIHGGRASVDAVLGALSSLSGFRMADPGEYTRRAFANGRMDLTAVEGLSDLIRAETEAQRRQALEQADGGLKDLYQGWATRLTHARAMIEAELDFSDEEDVPGSVTDLVWPDMALLAQEIAGHLQNAKAGELIRDGFRIALIGPPNVGKSSLLNRLAQRDVAIVSATPGTTRDVVEVRLDIGGRLVLLQDTAGLRQSSDAVELEGMRRSRATAETADLVLELRDLADTAAGTADNTADAGDSLLIWTKADLVATNSKEMQKPGLLVSSTTGFGVDELIAELSHRISKSVATHAELAPSRARHVELLQSCLRDLQEAITDPESPIEIRSENLRSAAASLGRITGSVDVEDLLGVIFSEFCVGK
ncbi:tRNA uridine-5-carboxymethylaminomethyl(34) synthesis GTPase MnmE [Hoeflea sp. YIM 152468]|uniref:tRNA uridine-5-carboxymethylaminomethyl(34) synthesis GTPase MnmE n=1 Tax=Hoeflea sp. YIM 152468 TaxID=3031759 RepID=UPI0023DBB3A0|nr:tRNA uridine-5-carboxymethylaminomethyl(34) synthesis GTPase MnmE [Hoeflea sp. YIM 152468]MDF1610504.1 tRNA uridine-5-carboxymethylaminomethyl(34) synthesis GTPase MnmE [Hoeflea sp. YIM 152468]